MVGQIFRQHDIARLDDRRQGDEHGLCRAIGDQDPVCLYRDPEPPEPGLTRRAMPVEPGDRPAGPHPGAVFLLRHGPHERLRRGFVAIGIGGTDNREIDDVARVAVEHE
ncbi:MAG: hypothetical protein ACREFO_15615, partial [Acetobacteraceae bacterium]